MTGSRSGIYRSINMTDSLKPVGCTSGLGAARPSLHNRRTWIHTGLSPAPLFIASTSVARVNLDAESLEPFAHSCSGYTHQDEECMHSIVVVS